MFISSLLGFPAKERISGQNSLKKVVRDTILHCSGHADCHLDTKNGPAKVQWTYIIHLQNTPIENCLFTIFPIFWVS